MANYYEERELEMARRRARQLAETRRLRPARPAPEDAYAEDTWGNAAKYVRNKFSGGMSDTAGLAVDTTAGAINLGIAGYGLAKGELTGSSELPEPITEYYGGSKSFDKIFNVDRKVKPTGEVNRFLGGAAQFLGGGVPMAATAFKNAIHPAVQTLPQAARAVAPVAIGETVGALGAQGGVEMANKYAPDSMVAQTALPLLFGAPPGALAQRYSGSIDSAATKARALAEGKTGTPIVDMVMDNKTIREGLQRNVRNRIATDLKGYIDSERSLVEATDLAEKFPGLRLTPGQASGAPEITAREQKYALSSAEALNRRIRLERANQDALTKKVDATLTGQPFTAARSVRDMQEQQALGVASQRQAQLQQIEKLDVEIEALERAKVGRVDAMRSTKTPEKVGAEIKALQKELKVKYQARTDELYKSAGNAADDAGAYFHGDDFIAHADDLVNRGVLQAKQGDVPTLAKLIGKSDDVDAEASGARKRTELMSFSEVKGMREELNRAVRKEERSQVEGSLVRARELRDLRATLDKSINDSEFDEVATLYRKANAYYQDVMVPKFYEGENFEIRARASFNTPRVEDAEVAAKFLIPGNKGVAPLNRYLRTFSESPAGMKTMEAEFMDRYARAVAPYGEFKPAAQTKFHEDYKMQLDKMTEAGSSIKATLGDAETALAKISEEIQTKIANRETLAKSELAKVVTSKDGSPVKPHVVIEAALSNKQEMISFLHNAEAAAVAKGRDKDTAAKAVAASVFSYYGKSVVQKGDYPSIDPTKLRKFLDEKESALMPLFSRAYGLDKAKGYIHDLKDIARISEIQARSQMSREKLPRVATAASGDALKQETGISALSVFPVLRAVIAGRTSTTQASTVMGGQAATHLVLKKMGEIEQQILSDPNAAKQLLEIMRSGTQSASKSAAYAKLAWSIGEYMIGKKHYGPITAFLTPGTIHSAREANEESKKRAAQPKKHYDPLPTRRPPMPTRRVEPLERLMNP